VTFLNHVVKERRTVLKIQLRIKRKVECRSMEISEPGCIKNEKAARIQWFMLAILAI
jgi:hypothetical protein